MKTIVVTIILILSVSAPPAMGRLVDLPTADLGQPKIPAFGTISLEQVFWAQNDTSENEKTEGSKSGTETKKSESTDDDKKKSSDATSKPLKPFVPSEKIPGDQAVDFPVDI
jgi:hypothetical protein